MILLGLEGSAPHAVRVVGMNMVEVEHGVDWNDRGVIVRPFAHPPGARANLWSVVPHSTVQPSDGAAVLAFADELTAALQRISIRAVGA